MGHEESEGGKIDMSIKNALEFDLFVKYSLEITTTTGVRENLLSLLTYKDPPLLQDTTGPTKTPPLGVINRPTK